MIIEVFLITDFAQRTLAAVGEGEVSKPFEGQELLVTLVDALPGCSRVPRECIAVGS